MKILDKDMNYLKYDLINNQKIYNLNSETNDNFIAKYHISRKNLSKPSLKSSFRSRNDLLCCLYEILEFPNKNYLKENDKVDQWANY